MEHVRHTDITVRMHVHWQTAAKRILQAAVHLAPRRCRAPSTLIVCFQTRAGLEVLGRKSDHPTDIPCQNSNDVLCDVLSMLLFDLGVYRGICKYTCTTWSKCF